MYIGIDFDGTCVTHSYPYIGKDIGAIPVLRKLVEKGHKLILFTMRSEKTLADAVRWFKENEIPLFGIQTNPTQVSWTKSPKAYCNLYIDDAGLGCPLKWDKDLSDREFVDWFSAEQMLVKLGYL
jgi:hypothetical protein